MLPPVSALDRSTHIGTKLATAACCGAKLASRVEAAKVALEKISTRSAVCVASATATKRTRCTHAAVEKLKCSRYV